MITYRDAAAEDAPALAAFAARTFVETFGHLYPPEDLAAYLAAKYAPDVQAEEIRDPNIAYRLALRGDEIAGYCMWGPVGLKALGAAAGRELYRLYVDGDARGAGVAQELMRAMLEAARAAGAEAVYLSVWENNERAQRFYRRFGFEHIGEHKFMVGRVADRDFIWRLKL